jgi:hypothetical protein
MCFLPLVLGDADSFQRDEPYRAARAGRPGDIGHLVPASDAAALGLPFFPMSRRFCAYTALSNWLINERFRRLQQATGEPT